MYEGYRSLTMDVLVLAREQESETSASHRIRVMHDEKSASSVNDSNLGHSPREVHFQSAFTRQPLSPEFFSDITSLLRCETKYESIVTPFWPATLRMRHVFFHHHYVTWHDEPPVCSPFLVPTLIILGLLNCFNIVSKGHWCKAPGTVTTLSLMAPVLPICMAISDEHTIVSLHAVCPRGKRYKSEDGPFRWSARKDHSSLLQRANPVLWWCFLLMALALIGVFLTQPRLFVNCREPFGIWTRECRIGEADNPGPLMAFSTLNVASMSRNQDLLVEPSQIPMVNVYTETCLTKTVLPSVKARTKEASRFLVTGCMVALRKNLVKLDRHARGDSGGVLLASDVPSRPSSTPMDPPAWHSTRLCEALLVTFTPQITVRVVGFYGFAESSRRSTPSVELNDNLLSYVFKYIAQSTHPPMHSHAKFQWGY